MIHHNLVPNHRLSLIVLYHFHFLLRLEASYVEDFIPPHFCMHLNMRLVLICKYLQIFVDCSTLLYSKFILPYAFREFLSKHFTSVVQQTTKESMHMLSPKPELGINPVSEETWKRLSLPVMLEGDRLSTP